VTSLSDPDAPPLTVSEEMGSGSVLEKVKPKPIAAARSPRPVRTPLSPKRVTIVAALLVVSVLGVWFVLYGLFFSNLQENHSQHVLYMQLRSHLAQVITPFGGAIPGGTPVALINAPELGMTRVVMVEGSTSADLEKGPGHFAASPFPGQLGRSVIFGRSATFGSPFAKLHAAKPGDKITITTGQGQFGFSVVGVRGPNQPQPSLAQLGTSSLELITSTGSGWHTGWAPTHAIYIDAKLIAGKVVQTPAGQPVSTQLSSADYVLAGDTSGLVPLVLWLQALVLLTLGLVYSYGKWSPWQMWLVAMPAVLAVLWGATSSAMLLLPNLA
jgi:sortase A